MMNQRPEAGLFGWVRPRFLQIRLGNESCDQISASPNIPKRAKSRDKTAGSLFTRVYTLVEFSQTKRCFFSFLKQNIQRQMIHQHHYSLHNTNKMIKLVKNKMIILFFLFFLLILLAIDKCNRASPLAISVSQHCERAFRTPFICLCAPYMKRHSLRRSIEPKEGHKTTGASKNIFSIFVFNV